MAQKNNSKNPALFLLALLKNANATMRLAPGTLEIGPVGIAKRLAPKIREHKADLVRFLLGKSCPLCGDLVRMRPTGRFDGKNWLTGLYCVNCPYETNHQMPDFPVYDKTGKEI